MDLGKKGMLLVVFTALVSGFSIFINAWAVRGFDSSVFTFAKNLVVAVLLCCVILGFGLWRELRALSWRQWRSLIVLGVIGGGIPFLLYFKGVQLANASTASFLHKSIFLPVAILAFLFLKERMDRFALVGAGLLVAGTFLAVAPKISLGTGFFLILAAVLFWAADNVLAKRLVKDMTGTLVGFGRMFFGSVFILLFLVVTGKSSMVVSMSGAQYLWILLTACLLFLFVFSYYNALRHVKVHVAASMLSLGLPVTLVLDAVFRSVSLTFQSALGLVLILAGVVLVAWLSQLKSLVRSADARWA